MFCQGSFLKFSFKSFICFSFRIHTTAEIREGEEKCRFYLFMFQINPRSPAPARATTPVACTPGSAGINAVRAVFALFQDRVLHGLQAGVRGAVPDGVQVLPGVVPARRRCRLPAP